MDAIDRMPAQSHHSSGYAHAPQTSRKQFAPSAGERPIREDRFPCYEIAPSVVFAPTSFFHDRAIPEHDVIQLPQKLMPAGSVTLEDLGLTTRAAKDRRSGLRLLKDRLRGIDRYARATLPDAVVLDLRANHPQNWSHLLNFHVPLIALAESSTELAGKPFKVLFPHDMPSHARKALALLGVDAVYTDGPVTGRIIDPRMSHHNAFRPLSREWFVRSQMAKLKAKAEAEATTELPHRVLIARRGLRRLTNLKEIEAALAPFSFKTVYAEDLTVIDQFRLFSQCETIVAIHGAGLGPLLLRTEGKLPAPNIVELIPCGIASDFFRMMAQQVGARWVGVRGRIQPRYLASAYDLKKSFFAEFQNDDVDIEPRSLLQALQHVWHAKYPGDAPSEPYSIPPSV